MERLQKVIARAGIASRRKAEELILQGRVKVNGRVVKELGVKVGPRDDVEVDGIPIEREEPVYYLLYKPRGVISSVKDDKGRKVVTDFFKDLDKRIYPIGRLDYDTSGLLLLTNDGDFANLLMHPRYEIEKVYIAKSERHSNARTAEAARTRSAVGRWHDGASQSEAALRRPEEGDSHCGNPYPRRTKPASAPHV
ncbi:Ribosomal large subunit pseudouridine synthase B [Geobacillus sp. BCO2]|nr:Ribosomal large subunit pseudouridine synthase B [Geobacillus sp. BCO2]